MKQHVLICLTAINPQHSFVLHQLVGRFSRCLGYWGSVSGEADRRSGHDVRKVEVKVAKGK